MRPTLWYCSLPAALVTDRRRLSRIVRLRKSIDLIE